MWKCLLREPEKNQDGNRTLEDNATVTLLDGCESCQYLIF